MTERDIMYTPEGYLAFDRAFFWERYSEERERCILMLKEGRKILADEGQKSTVGRSLDAGSVSGFYPHLFWGFGLEAHGVNIDSQALHYARENGIQYHGWNSLPPEEELDDFIYKLQRVVHFTQGDMLQLPFLGESFGVVTVMSGTFSHIPDHDRALSEFGRVLAPYGFLVISDWNIASPTQDFAGIYTQEQQELLRRRHLVYPHLLTKLHSNGFEPRAAYLHSGNNMYMVLATRNP